MTPEHTITLTLADFPRGEGDFFFQGDLLVLGPSPLPPRGGGGRPQVGKMTNPTPKAPEKFGGVSIKNVQK